MITVTISIVSYNTKDYTIRCIDSIYRHTKGLSFEVIVVDNNSSDGTQKLIEEKFPNVILIKNKKNKFYGGANNQALKISRGKYFLILNADTYFKDNSIKKMVEYLDMHPEIGAVEGLEIYENGKLIPNGSRKNTPLVDFYELSIIGKRLKNNKLIKTFRISNKNRRDTFKIDVGCDAFLMVRTNLFIEIGGYDEKLLLYYTENDICLRIQKKGLEIVHFGDAFVYHKVSVSANKLKWKKLDLYYNDLLIYYKKHGYVISGNLLFVLLKFEKLLLKIFRPNMFEN